MKTKNMTKEKTNIKINETFVSDKYLKLPNGNMSTIKKEFDAKDAWKYSLDVLKTKLQNNDKAMDKILQIEVGVNEIKKLSSEMERYKEAYENYVFLLNNRTKADRDVFGAAGDRRGAKDGYLKELYDEAINAGAIMTPSVIAVGEKLMTVVDVFSKKRISAPVFLEALVEYFNDGTGMGDKITQKIQAIFKDLSTKLTNGEYIPKVKEIDDTIEFEDDHVVEGIMSSITNWIKRATKFVKSNLSKIAKGFANNKKILTILDDAIGVKESKTKSKIMTFTEFLDNKYDL